jgi:hypothetical protein
VQLDVPQIAMGLADGGWETAEAVGTIAAMFKGFTSSGRSVRLGYGDFGAWTWVRNRAFSPLLPNIQALVGIVDRVVLAADDAKRLQSVLVRPYSGNCPKRAPGESRCLPAVKLPGCRSGI